MNAPDVLIIGTEPPCPRCDRLLLLAAQALGSATTPRHCAFTAPEAQALAARLGRRIGTAHHVAQAAGLKVDWEAVARTLDPTDRPVRLDGRPADAWTPELDALLRPCEDAADAVDFLMTPVLVVNGVVKHHGSVPAPEAVARWLAEG